MTQFRVESTGQSVTGGVIETITFQREIDELFNVVSGGVFTVPANWNGQYATFSIGIRLGGSPIGYVSLQLSTDGGSVYNLDQQTNISTSQNMWLESGPRLLVTGHKYRVQVSSNTNQTVQDSERSFFTGRLLNQTWENTGYFRAIANSTQLIASGGAVTQPLTNLNTVQFDTTAGFSASVYTVPGFLSGGSGIFYGGIDHDGDVGRDMTIFMSVSTDGGSSYSSITQNDRGLSRGGNVSTGMRTLVAGHKYRVEAFNASLTFTVAANAQTFMAGEMWRAGL